MKKGIFLLFFCGLLYSKIIVNLSKESIKFDGIIDEPEWKDASIISDFTQLQPNPGFRPSFKTQVFIKGDKENLYIGFLCYDSDMKKLRATLTQRDEPYMDDIVGVMIDSYGKEKEAFVFFSNPYGIQMDGIQQGGKNADFTFDTDFYTKAKISKDFWSVEFVIPFSSLRFVPDDTLLFKIIFLRQRPRDANEIYTFPEIDVGNPSMLSQAETLVITYKPLFHTRNLELMPYLIFNQEGFSDSTYRNEKLNYDLGITGKWSKSSNFIIDFTINPDFSQIETDAPQIDVNTPFALYYPEKRPFFLEGKNLVELSPYFRLFYSRNINNPFYALKLTGKIRGNSFYFLSAMDENTPWVIPFRDASYTVLSNDTSFSNILRIKRDLKGDSYAGIFLLSRELKGSYSRVFAGDIFIRFFEHYSLGYIGAITSTKEPDDTTLFNPDYRGEVKEFTPAFDGEVLRGYRHNLSFNATFKNLETTFWYNIAPPTFRSDLGFIRSNDENGFGIFISPRFYPNRYIFNTIRFSFSYSRDYNFENEIESEEYSFSSFFNLIRQTSLGLRMEKKAKRVYGVYFPELFEAGIFLNSSPHRDLSFSFSFKQEKTIFYESLEYAYEREAEFESFLKIIDRIQIGGGLTGYYLYREYFKNVIYKITIFRVKVNYQLTRNLSLRTIIQGNTGQNRLEVYPLLSYEPNAFTSIYLGANLNFNTENNINLYSHQLFLKIRYWFKI